MKSPTIVRRVILRPPSRHKKNYQLIYTLNRRVRQGDRWTYERKYQTLDCDGPTAQRILERVRAEITLGQFDPETLDRPDGGVTLTALRDMHLRTIKNRNTRRIRAEAFRLLVDVTGDGLAAQLAPADVDRFIEALQRTPSRYSDAYTENSITTYVSHLSAAYGWAIRKGILQANPFQGKRPRRSGGVRTRRRHKNSFYTEEQIEAIRGAAAAGPPWWLFAINLSLWTGCRVGGVLNANRGRLYWQTIDERQQWFLTITEKGAKTRDVPLPRRCVNMLHEREDYLTDPQGRAYRQRLRAGYYIVEVAGEHRAESVTRMFARLLRKVGLPGSFHWLRHTYARGYLESGGDIGTLSMILGHSDVRTTMDHYGHFTHRTLAAGIDERAGL